MKLFHTPNFMSIGTIAIELRVFRKKKNHGQMGKLFIAVIFTFGAFQQRYMLSFHIFSAVKSYMT